MQSKKIPFSKKPSQDIVECGKDGVGYELNNLNQPATGAEQNKTEDSGVQNDHILRYEDGGAGEMNLMPKLAQKFLAQVVASLVLIFLTLSRF